MTTDQNLKYEEEYETMKDGGDWFKPQQGFHTLTFLGELSVVQKRTLTFAGQNKEVEQSDVLIENNGKKQKWSVTKSQSKNSLYGRLVFLGKTWKGLTGKTVHITVEGEGKTRRTSIQEYAQLISQQTKI